MSTQSLQQYSTVRWSEEAFTITRLTALELEREACGRLKAASSL